MTLNDNSEIIKSDNSYRIPVFHIPRRKITTGTNDEMFANYVRIHYCDLALNLYNITFDNNVIRWLRKPYITDTFNELDYYTSKGNIQFETTPWILCQLYIPPNIYNNIPSIIAAINMKLQNSIKDLFSNNIDNNVFSTSNIDSPYWLRDSDTTQSWYYATAEDQDKDIRSGLPISPPNSSISIGIGNVELQVYTDVSDPPIAHTFKVYLNVDEYIRLGGLSLIKVPYFTNILNEIGGSEVSSAYDSTAADQASISMFTSFKCIPVTFDKIIYSNTQGSFLDIQFKPQFYNLYDTVLAPVLLNCVGNELQPSNNEEMVQRQLDNLTNGGSGFFYNFTHTSDIWKSLGYSPCVIDYDSVIKTTYTDDNDLYETPIYTVFGQYYSEMIYNGPIASSYSFTDTSTSLLYKVSVGQDLRFIDETVLNNNFYTNLHYGSIAPNVATAKSLTFHVSYNQDIEKVINFLKKDNKAKKNSIYNYDLLRPNEGILVNIPQRIELNQSIKFANEGDLYLYITSNEYNYPMVTGDYEISVEYHL